MVLLVLPAIPSFLLFEVTSPHYDRDPLHYPRRQWRWLVQRAHAPFPTGEQMGARGSLLASMGESRVVWNCNRERQVWAGREGIESERGASISAAPSLSHHSSKKRVVGVLCANVCVCVFVFVFVSERALKEQQGRDGDKRGWRWEEAERERWTPTTRVKYEWFLPCLQHILSAVLAPRGQVDLATGGSAQDLVALGTHDHVVCMAEDSSAVCVCVHIHCGHDMELQEVRQSCGTTSHGHRDTATRDDCWWPTNTTTTTRG